MTRTETRRTSARAVRAAAATLAVGLLTRSTLPAILAGGTVLGLGTWLA